MRICKLFVKHAIHEKAIGFNERLPLVSRDNDGGFISDTKFTDGKTMRVNPSLAAEIGLNESIILLQFEYLISISQNEREGRLWTFQTLSDLKLEYFPWLSIATISRAIESLKERGLVLAGNFNKRASDRTLWYSIDAETVLKLNSINIFQIAKSTRQNAKSFCNLQDSTLQNETALPEITSENTIKEKYIYAPAIFNASPDDPNIHIVRWFEENGKGIIKRPVNYANSLMDKRIDKMKGEIIGTDEYRITVLQCLHDLGPPPMDHGGFSSWQSKLYMTLSSYRNTGTYISPKVQPTGNGANGNGRKETWGEKAERNIEAVLARRAARNLGKPGNGIDSGG